MNRIAEFWRAGQEEQDGSSLAFLRVAYGLLATFGALRFLVYGWVDQFFSIPQFFFRYSGFEWVRPLDSQGMHALFWGLAALGLLIALGAFYRFAIVLYVVLFAYVELIDVTNYLNHYYLVIVMGIWMSFMPLGEVYGLDGMWSRRRGKAARTTLPKWMLNAVRLQMAIVYFYAALAKFSPDWLLHAQPLSIWLGSRSSSLGTGISDWLLRPEVAFIASWGAFLYDLTIPLWLSIRKTRPYAFVVLLSFHLFTHLFFTIGLFPLIMTLFATVFFEPDWGRKLLSKGAFARPPLSAAKRHDPGDRKKAHKTGNVPHQSALARRSMGFREAMLATTLAGFALLQVVYPMRAYAYDGDFLWHEQGMRFGWRVLCREKNGSVSYRVRVAGREREYRVEPTRYLTDHQAREMSGQPDLILQLAHHIESDFRSRGHREVEVRVDALASLNGRAPSRLIDPEVDLARAEDRVLYAQPWILPSPRDREAPLSAARRAE